MKSIYFAGLVVMSLLFACNKEKSQPEFTASITLVNAVTSYTNALKPSIGAEKQVYSAMAGVDYYYSARQNEFGVFTMGLPAGRAVQLRVVSSEDTIHSIYQREIKAASRDAFTLYVSGPPEHPDTLFMKDDFPIKNGDRSAIRFVDLSADAGTLSINVVGTDLGSAVSELTYQGISTFGFYSQPVEAFEIREKSSGTVIATYSFDSGANRFPQGKNVTIVIRGQRYGDPGLELVRINHY